MSLTDEQPRLRCLVKHEAHLLVSSNPHSVAQDGTITTGDEFWTLTSKTFYKILLITYGRCTLSQPTRRDKPQILRHSAMRHQIR